MSEPITWADVPFDAETERRPAQALHMAMAVVARLALAALLIPMPIAASSPAPDPSGGDADVSLEPPGHPAIRAFRIPGQVKIDGVLDDTAWQRPANNGLIQHEPDNGSAPIHLTDWWVGYDEHAIYAAFRCHDPAPDSIDASVARRDASLVTDEVFLELDTFNDDRNGYLFVTGAGGYFLDAVLYNDGSWDSSWDGVWSTASRVDAEGWVAEMRIPFSQLAFAPTEEQVWGINVVRNCKRFQSTDYLFHKPRNESGYVSRYPDLVGLRGIEPGSNREGTLYVVSKGEYLQVDDGDPFNDGSRYAADLGGDLKWGLTSNLTLNATINPDFGQVEVDPAVVNLSDFETFFPEKRPFFVQDANVFRFGRDGTSSNWSFNWSDPTLFYSRRVGRSPQLGVEGDADYVDSPRGTTILGAAKVTGTIGNTSVGALSALTAREHHELALGGDHTRELAEPTASYNLLRATRTSEDSQHAIGVMLTGTERDLSDPKSEAELTRRAYSGGVDGWLHLDDDGRWAMRGYVAGSWIQGDERAIDDRQRSSLRYMHRPDASHLDYDPTRTSLAGWSSRVMLNKEKGDYSLNTALGATSPGFEISDLGFQGRADLVNTHLAVGKDWNDPKGILRGRNVNVSTYWTWDFGGTRTGGGMGASFWSEFTNYWSVNGGVFYNPERNSNTITRGGPLLRRPINREFNVGFSSDRRKSWRLSGWGFGSWGGPGEASSYTEIGLEIKPTTALTMSLSPQYSWERYGSQYVDTIEDPVMTRTFGSRYVFADLEYSEVSATLRMDWSFTPRLTLQTYLQPLIAVGDYRNLKEFAEPETFEFEVYGEKPGSAISYDASAEEYLVDPGDGGETFTVSDPDFNFKSLRLNMVLRWEYDPGSTLYLVWTRNGTNFANPGRFDLGRDVGDLIDAPGDDVLLVKVSRWFDF